MPAVTRRDQSTVNATQKSGLHVEYHGAPQMRKEGREGADNFSGPSVGLRGGWPISSEKTKEMKSLARERQREKKRHQERKNILVSVPGFENPPFPSPTTRSMTGLASLPWRLGLWLHDKGALRSKGGLT